MQQVMKCESCGSDAIHLVEKAEVWYPLTGVEDDGTLLFDAANRAVSDEGEAQQVECSACSTAVPGVLPVYDWV